MLKFNVLLYFAVFLFSTQLQAQSRQGLDSLKQILPSQSDTIRINTLLQISKFFYQLTGPADSVRRYAEMALQEATKMAHHDGITKANYCIGLSYVKDKAYDKAIRFLQIAHKQMIPSNNIRGIAAVLNNIGLCYMEQNAYEKALSLFMESLDWEEKAGKYQNLGPVYNNIAIAFVRMEQYEKSKKYKLKAFKYGLAAGDSISALQTANNLSYDYMALNQYDSAKYYATYALNLSQRLGVPEGIIRTKNKLALIALSQNQYQEAQEHLTVAIQKANPDIYPHLLSSSYRFKAIIDDSLKLYNSALEHANRSLAYAQTAHDEVELLAIYEVLFDIHKKLGDFSTAIKYQEQYKTLEDSIFGREQRQRIQALLTQFEKEKQEQELESLSHANEIQQLALKQKNTLLISLSLGAVLLLLSVYFFNRQKVLKEKQLALEANQRSLLAQMNPHFLFHALSSIQLFIYEQEDRKKAGLYLAKFAKLMRLILENSREPLIPLDRELQTLRYYLELQQIRFQHTFAYEIRIDDSIKPEELMIPPMFAQPFIENSLEHGFLNKKDQGKIQLSFTREGERLHFKVEDNGIGREESAALNKQKEHRSLAIEITRDRLKLLQKKIKEHIDLHIIDLQDEHKNITGTQVSFSLPLMYA